MKKTNFILSLKVNEFHRKFNESKSKLGFTFIRKKNYKKFFSSGTHLGLR
jgi:hypothetical protein